MAGSFHLKKPEKYQMTSPHQCVCGTCLSKKDEHIQLEDLDYDLFSMANSELVYIKIHLLVFHIYK